jgi:hypothetical protein
MDTPLALAVTTDNEAERQRVGVLTKRAHEVMGEQVDIRYADAGYTGGDTAAVAEKHETCLVVVKRPGASKGLVLLPRRARSRTQLRLGQPLLPVRPRRRASPRHRDWPACRRLRLPLAAKTAQLD